MWEEKWRIKSNSEKIKSKAKHRDSEIIFQSLTNGIKFMKSEQEIKKRNFK